MSEIELPAKLQATGIGGIGYLSEVAVRKGCIEAAKLGVVERVEGFEPQFQSRALASCKRNGLEQGRVEVESSWSNNGIPLGVAKALISAAEPWRDRCGKRTLG